jgi:hypothetical protein
MLGASTATAQARIDGSATPSHNLLASLTFPFRLAAQCRLLLILSLDLSGVSQMESTKKKLSRIQYTHPGYRNVSVPGYIVYPFRDRSGFRV